jgi:hypothetical protein
MGHYLQGMFEDIYQEEIKATTLDMAEDILTLRVNNLKSTYILTAST